MGEVCGSDPLFGTQAKLKGNAYVAALTSSQYVASPPGVGHVNFRDVESIVAAAVPVLEAGRWPPLRGPIAAVHGEVSHILVKNASSWRALTRAHLIRGRPKGDARKFYLPYWLAFLFERLDTVAPLPVLHAQR
jgi:hypothetical protein